MGDRLKFTKIICCGFLFSLPGCGGSTGQTPLFETPEWVMRLEYGIDLSLRRENALQKDSGLLIKHDNRQPLVRRYNPKQKRLEIVPTELWDKSTEPIARCVEQGPPATLEFDKKTKQLIGEKGEIIPTKGRTVLNMTASPQKSRVAVLSASGIAGGDYSIIPFSSGTGASGQYWMQIYSLETRQMEKYLFKIPKKRRFTSLHACWSADEKFVIYKEVTYEFIVVIYLD